MNLAHKIQLDPTIKQVEYFNKAVGTARFTYNWALTEWNKQYAEGQKPTALKLKKQFNEIKYKEYPWMKEIHRDAHSQPFENLGNAFDRFFKKKAKYPKLRKKYKRDSFYVANDRVSVEENNVRLPIIGWVRLRESLRFDGKTTGCVVSRKADKWYISVMVDVKDYHRERKSDNIVGVDLGLITYATLDTGEKINSPNMLKNNLKKLRRLSREHSRKKKGSKNRKKSTIKLAKQHAVIAFARKDFIDKLTTRLCSENQVIIIEDLCVENMVKNKKLARSISDAGWGEFRRQLVYKSEIYNTRIIKANRFFPSSKLCSICGYRNDKLTLKDRVYECPECGLIVDRDVNAAKNLYTFGLKEIEACGHNVRPFEKKAVVDEAGTKTCSLVDTN